MLWPDGLRLSGERSGAERVRCSRRFRREVLMSWDMPGRYAWAAFPFNGLELASAGNR
jgi:hypothetical protein